MTNGCGGGFQPNPWEIVVGDADAPALRWASEFSQRENCHLSDTTEAFSE